MVPHIVYFDILVTIQRHFINVQYRDTSKIENMVRIGVPIAKTAIASLYFQCYNPISYSGHPRGSTNIGWLRCVCGGGGGARGSYLSGPRPTRTEHDTWLTLASWDCFEKCQYVHVIHVFKSCSDIKSIFITSEHLHTFYISVSNMLLGLFTECGT